MALPVITPMLTWREQQISWFSEPVIIKQDQQLIDYITHNHVQCAKIYGDDFFSQYVHKVDCGPVGLVIWIQNQSFKFDQLVTDINNEIANNLCAGGTLYLAVNKFLCTQPESDRDLPDNYDDAILKYMQNNVDAVVEQYFPDLDSTGTMFNWVHPLTRFYFKK
jgi:hypothetical protein